jgi:hypothetical protein
MLCFVVRMNNQMEIEGYDQQVLCNAAKLAVSAL